MGEMTQDLRGVMRRAQRLYHKPGSTIVAVVFANQADADVYKNIVRRLFAEAAYRRRPRHAAVR